MLGLPHPPRLHIYHSYTGPPDQRLTTPLSEGGKPRPHLQKGLDRDRWRGPTRPTPLSLSRPARGALTVSFSEIFAPEALIFGRRGSLLGEGGTPRHHLRKGLDRYRWRGATYTLPSPSWPPGLSGLAGQIVSGGRGSYRVRSDRSEGVTVATSGRLGFGKGSRGAMKTGR